MRNRDTDSLSHENTKQNPIKALIPQKMSNEMVLSVMRMVQTKGSVKMTEKAARRRERNAKRYIVHLAEIEKANGYIENQNRYKDMRYGSKALSYNGCEIIAVYNALRFLDGQHMQTLDQLIEEFEQEGMLLNGVFGTSPDAMQNHFERAGRQTIAATNEDVFEQLVKETDTAIMTFYNDGYDITKQIHTVHISKENGKLYAHNAFCNGRVLGPCASVREMLSKINDGKAKGIYILGVMK